ncbi:MAG: IPT/TIG domain-containing protein, partial [Bacteroidia bacterium]|nr:IPT/TIG domain-containing protein [Bacteroidia bacterium]
MRIFNRTPNGCGWILAATLTPGSTQSSYGTSLALSADGTNLVVGAPRFNNDQGSIYLYDFNGSSWVQTQQLFGPVLGSNYGFSLGLSASGNTLVVGAPEEDSRKGAAYVYQRSGINLFNQTARLSARTPQANALFGFSVAISALGELIAVGAPAYNSSQGQVRVFENENPSLGDPWLPRNEDEDLLTGTTSFAQRFGQSLSFSPLGNFLAVGAPISVSPGGGQVCVYDMSNLTQLGDTIVPSGLVAGARFGDAVALSADGLILMVGSPNRSATGSSLDGGVWFYRRPQLASNEWTLIEGGLFTQEGGEGQLGAAVALTYTGSQGVAGARTLRGEAEGRAFTFTPRQEVSGIPEPRAFKPGDVLRIQGLAINQGQIETVLLNDTPLPGPYTIVSSREFRVTLPSSVTAADSFEVKVRFACDPTVQALPAKIFIAPAPTISSFSPQSQGFGQEITIQGTNFYPPAVGNLRVTVGDNDLELTLLEQSPTLLRVKVETPTSGKIRVTALGGTAQSAQDFTFVPAPILIDLSPRSVRVGDRVTITGKNFVSGLQLFSGAAPVLGVTRVSDTELQFQVSDGFIPEPLNVVTVGGRDTFRTLTLSIGSLEPVLSSFSPQFAWQDTVNVFTCQIRSDSILKTQVVFSPTPVVGPEVALPITQDNLLGQLPTGEFRVRFEGLSASLSVPGKYRVGVRRIGGIVQHSDSILSLVARPAFAQVSGVVKGFLRGTVSLPGANFGSSGILTIGGDTIPLQSVNDGLLVFETPIESSGPIVYTGVGGATLQPLTFERDVSTVAIDSISPRMGVLPLQRLVLRGTNLAQVDQVLFGPTKVPSP